MSVSFPNPFSDMVVDHITKLIEESELNDLIAAMDTQINSHIIPEWYQADSISRIYVILLEIQGKFANRHQGEKVSALLSYMRLKYEDKLYSE